MVKHIYLEHQWFIINLYYKKWLCVGSNHEQKKNPDFKFVPMESDVILNKYPETIRTMCDMFSGAKDRSTLRCLKMLANIGLIQSRCNRIHLKIL